MWSKGGRGGVREGEGRGINGEGIEGKREGQ